jgi:hypothetical protein
MGKYSKNFELNLQDLKARDWEVIDIEAEVNQTQQDIKDGKF